MIDENETQTAETVETPQPTTDNGFGVDQTPIGFILLDGHLVNGSAVACVRPGEGGHLLVELVGGQTIALASSMDQFVALMHGADSRIRKTENEHVREKMAMFALGAMEAPDDDVEEIPGPKLYESIREYLARIDGTSLMWPTQPKADGGFSSLPANWKWSGSEWVTPKALSEPLDTDSDTSTEG